MYSLIFNSINSIFRSKVGRVFLLISYSVNIIMTKSVIFALHNNKPFSYRFLIIIKIYNCGNWIIRFICFSRISEMTRFTPEDKQVVDNYLELSGTIWNYLNYLEMIRNTIRIQISRSLVSRHWGHWCRHWIL